MHDTIQGHIVGKAQYKEKPKPYTVQGHIIGKTQGYAINLIQYKVILLIRHSTRLNQRPYTVQCHIIGNTQGYAIDMILYKVIL
jgi:hypothetical protein